MLNRKRMIYAKFLDQLILETSQISIQRYTASFDDYNGKVLSGWIKKQYLDETSKISLYHNGELIIADIQNNLQINHLTAMENENPNLDFFIEVEPGSWHGIFALRNKDGSQTYAIKIYEAQKLLNEKEQYDRFQILWQQKRFDEAYLFIDNLLLMYPDNYNYNINFIYFCIAWHNYTLLIKEMAAINYENDSILKLDIPENEFFINCMEKVLLNIRLNNLLLESDNQILAKALHLLSVLNEDYLSLKTNLLNSLGSYDVPNVFKEGIAFYAANIDYLKFILPVIYYLPSFLITIIIGNLDEKHQFIKKELCGKGYTVLEGKDNLEKFKIIALDHVFFKTHLKNFDTSEKIVISYGHGVDATPYYGTKFNLYLTTNEYQVRGYYDYAIDKDNISILNEIPQPNRQEYAYTGPWHISSFLKKRATDKHELRQMIADNYNKPIPEGKRLIAIFDDGMTSKHLLINTANILSEEYIVIIKFIRHLPPPPELLQTISPQIIIYDEEWAPNELRFASDFIICGYTGSTALSSLMLGINFIPYYSKELLYTWETHNNVHQWTENMPDGKTLIIPSSKQIFLSIWPRLFDIEDIESIHSAIDKPDYEDWYKRNLKILQKSIFGNYMLDRADEKTAEYILRFACNGTLGKDCLGINLTNFA